MAEDKKEEKIEEKMENKEKKETKPVENKQEVKQEKTAPKQETTKKEVNSVKEEKTKKPVENKEVKKETTVKKEVPEKKFEPVKKETAKNTTTEKAKTKGKGNRILLAILVIVVAVIIVGIIWMTARTPRKSVESMLQAIKSADFKKASEYVDTSKLENVPGMGQEDAKEMEKVYYESLKWKVHKITEEKDTAKVEIEVTNKNFKTVYTNYFQKAVLGAFSGQTMSDEETKEYLKEQVKSADTMTTTQTINLTKKDGKWMIENDENLMKAIYPGMADAINSISSLFSGQE